MWIGCGHLGCLLLLGCLGIMHHFTLNFYIALLLAASVAIYQQYLIKDREPKRCFQAFLNNNYFGMLLFLGVLSA